MLTITVVDGFLGEPLAQDSLPAWLTLVVEQLSEVVDCNSKWQPLQLRAQRYHPKPSRSPCNPSCSPACIQAMRAPDLIVRSGRAGPTAPLF
jgi:hypothetical protein